MIGIGGSESLGSFVNEVHRGSAKLKGQLWDCIDRSFCKSRAGRPKLNDRL